MLSKESGIKKSSAYLAQGLAQAACARPSCSRKGLAQGTRASLCASNSRKQMFQNLMNVFLQNACTRKARARLAQVLCIVMQGCQAGFCASNSRKQLAQGLAQEPCASKLAQAFDFLIVFMKQSIHICICMHMSVYVYAYVDANNMYTCMRVCVKRHTCTYIVPMRVCIWIHT